MRKVLTRIMNHEALASRPPVLVDIGASGSLPRAWLPIAEFSVCVAFDADTRDFSVQQSENCGWRKMVSVNRLVTAHSVESTAFYLTASPHCSSSLPPRTEALAPWAFRDLFSVESVVQMPATDINGALNAAGIDYVDWFKTDTQGTDLRIFAALPPRIRDRIIVAEFEPGIIDAYANEDKLHRLMAFMESLPFWISAMRVCGSQRITEPDFNTLTALQRACLPAILKTSPGWCEIAYINDLSGYAMTCREFLLGWTFATLQEQHGFGMHLANEGLARFQDSIFERLYAYSRRRLDRRWPAMVQHAVRQFVRRLHRNI